MSAEQLRRMQALAQDFAQGWNAPTTRSVDLPRLLGQLVEDVTLLREVWEVWVLPSRGVGDRARAGPSAAESSMAWGRASASSELRTGQARGSWPHGLGVGQRWGSAWAEP